MSKVETVELTEPGRRRWLRGQVAAGRLEELLAGLVPADAENLLVGLDPADDAAVYRLDDERALVFTVDFFPPVVDDPADFGAIAATNALNDVFAMGGVPLLALSVAAFPEELPVELLATIIGAADETVRSAGAILAGGHTIRDDEPKYGLAVVGTVRPDAVWRKSTARPGDAVFLTKPLGTGLVLHGHKRGLVGDGERAEAVRWMRTLNRDAADALRPFEPSAVTDVTGFGLLGHAYETASRSGVRIRLEAGRLAALPGALEVARAGERTGGDPRNRDFVGDRVSVDGVPDDLVALAFDAQTSGGSARRACPPSARRRSRRRSPPPGFTDQDRLGRGRSRASSSPDVTVAPGRVARMRALAVSPRAFVWLAAASAFSLYLILITGATVRLTASGLGCENWPGCQPGSRSRRRATTRYIEFGNRLVGGVTIALTLLAALGAFRVPGLPRSVRRLAVAVFVGALAQAPLGYFTVRFHLNPYLVHLALPALGGRAGGAR